MALPTYVGSGAVFNSAAAGSPALPVGIEVGDILLLEIETANQAITITNENGGTWAEVTNSPQGTGTAGGTTSTRLTVFWSRYNGTQGNPAISDSGDHQGARIHAFRGCPASGDPWNITSGNVEAASDTSLSATGATTTVADCLVCIMAALMDDAQNFGGTWTNASLANITVRQNSSGAAGNDWRHILVTGEKATAGAYSATTNTLTASSVKAMMTIALAPTADVTVALTGVVSTGGVGSVYRPFSDIRQEIINGLDSAQSEAAGWDAKRSAIAVTDVVRTSNTVVTITLPAIGTYDITAQETVTATVPGSALVGGGSAIVATPTFTIDPVTSGVQVALTGVAGTSNRGSLVAASTIALLGVLGSSAIGTLAPNRTIALTGVSSTGAVGTVGQAHDRALTGNVGTSAVGTLTPSNTLAVTGNAGTSAVGTVVYSAAQDREFALTGVSATTTVGNVLVVGDVTRAVTGVVATGAVNTFAITNTAAVTGNQATGAVGSVTLGDRSFAVTGVAGTSAVGSPSPTWTFQLAGNQAQTATGAVVVIGDRTAALTGVSATGLVGTITRASTYLGIIAKSTGTVTIRPANSGVGGIRSMKGVSVMDSYTTDNDSGTTDTTLMTTDRAPMGA